MMVKTNMGITITQVKAIIPLLPVRMKAVSFNALLCFGGNVLK